MANWLLDCQPLCNRPLLLGLATEPEEREEAYRLRYDVFFTEFGYRPEIAGEGKDIDSFDEWCDHLIVWDSELKQIIGTCRAINGKEAIKRGGLYGHDEFDYSALNPIMDSILQGSRICVLKEHRTGPAIQYLTYGMEMLRREQGCQYFLGSESFQTNDADKLSTIYSYVKKYCSDPEFYVEPQPRSRVPGLREVPVTKDDEKLLPSFVRADLRMGLLACSSPAWDPDFESYDILMLGRRDRFTPSWRRFLNRIERVIPQHTPKD